MPWLKLVVRDTKTKMTKTIKVRLPPFQASISCVYWYFSCLFYCGGTALSRNITGRFDDILSNNRFLYFGTRVILLVNAVTLSFLSIARISIDTAGEKKKTPPYKRRIAIGEAQLGFDKVRERRPRKWKTSEREKQ